MSCSRWPTTRAPGLGEWRGRWRSGVFAGKLQRAGLADVWVGGHQPFGIDQAALYPHHPEVIQVMRDTIPADHQDHVATGVIVKACRPQ